MKKPLKLRSGASFVAAATLTLVFVSVRAQQPPAAAAGQPPARGAAPAEQPPARGAAPAEQPPARGAAPAEQPPARGAAPEGRGAAPAAPAAKPLVPVATNTIAANSDAFYGQAVTITASIEEI